MENLLFDLPLDLIVAGFVAFAGGSALTFWRCRLHANRVAQVSALNHAVVESQVRTQAADVERQQQHISELQNRLIAREQELGRVRVTEASQKTTTHALTQQLVEFRDRLQSLKTERAALQEENSSQRERISHLMTALSEQKKHADEKLALLEQARERMNSDFKTLAQDVFESRQQVFREESKEQLSGLLDPLSDRIKEFEKRVADSYSQESKERFSLIREVKSLQDLNQRISKDAINLTNALKGENKTQGNWGEVILERVLERSGLQRGREYEVQVTLQNAEGRRRQPDVVIHLPEGKDVIIDAKVSLKAYEEYCTTDDPQSQQAAAQAHVASLRRHLKFLGEKDYQQLPGVNSLDFVLLFVPVEAAFAVAVQTDSGLFSDGFERNIVIVSPSTLLATLRTIQNIWRHEYQNRNAEEIARRAGALYDKFVNFVADLETIGSRIQTAQSAYQDAHKKLVSGKGSLVQRAENMKELGAKVSKALPKNLVEMPQRELDMLPPQVERGGNS